MKLGFVSHVVRVRVLIAHLVTALIEMIAEIVVSAVISLASAER